MSHLAAYILIFRRDKSPPTLEKMVDLFTQIGVIDEIDHEKLETFMKKRSTGDFDDICSNPGVWSIKDKNGKKTELRLRASEEVEDVIEVTNIFGEDGDGY